MEKFVCKNCGADLSAFAEASADGTVRCNRCLAPYTLPRKGASPMTLDLMRQGAEALEEGKFEEAAAFYLRAANSDEEEPEARFGMALAAFGVRYSRDEASDSFKPACALAPGGRFSEDENYLRALELATREQKRVYRTKAREIEEASSAEGVPAPAEKSSAPASPGAKDSTREQGSGSSDAELHRAAELARYARDEERRKQLAANESEKKHLFMKQFAVEDGVLTGYKPSGTSSEVEIPSGITAIGADAFNGCSHITRVRIRPGVTTIGERAFAGCPYLESVIVPEGVTEIGAWAFQNCMMLQEVELPEGLVTLGEGAFAKCGSLKHIKIPEGMERIEAHTFENCEDLCEVELPQSLFSIGEHAFEACTSLQEIELPEGVEKIEKRAFQYCDQLQSVSIPASVMWIHEGTFSYCSRMESISLPEELTTIAEEAFANCSSLKEISLPDKMHVIEKNAFIGCRGLVKLVIAGGEPEIEEDAFKGCTALKEIVLPPDIDQIHKSAFTDTAYFRDENNWDACGVLYIGTYLYASKSKKLVGSYKIRAHTRTIGDDALSYALELKRVSIPNSVKKIGQRAFECCIELRAIKFPPKLQEVGGGAFKGCNALTSVRFPGKVKEIGYHVLYQCKNLKKISVPSKFSSNVHSMIDSEQYKRVYFKVRR